MKTELNWDKILEKHIIKPNIKPINKQKEFYIIDDYSMFISNEMLDELNTLLIRNSYKVLNV